MKHDLLDSVYGDLYFGTPVSPDATWPRFDVMLRNGQEVTDIPGQYVHAAWLFDQGDPSKAEYIDQELSVLCVLPYDHDARVARLRALLEAGAGSEGPNSG